MTESRRVIAIDGPAGSGKSTVARELAERLGWDYIDTGAMYRCLCLKALEEGVPVDDESGLVNLLTETDLRMRFTDGRLRVWMDGREVTEKIRQNRVSRQVSTVAALEGVREQLVEEQRKMGEDGEVILDGRDIGTVVFPDARHKFYLDASLEIRAQRRYDELQKSSEDVSYESVVEEIRKRDRTDRGRSAGPMKPAEDAVRVDTSDYTAEEVVRTLLAHVRRKESSVSESR